MRKARPFRIELRSGNGQLISAASAVFPQGWHKPQIKRRLQEIVRSNVGEPPRGATWIFPAEANFGPAPTMPRNDPQRTTALRRKYGKDWYDHAA